MKGTSALVTGGAGFIGSHIVRALVAQGARVRVLDNLSSGTQANLAGVERKVDLQEGDIRNAVACRNACRGMDVVFHLAAFISVPGSVRDPVAADAVNIGGALNVLLAARDCGARRVVYSSSAAVYGDPEPAGDGPAVLAESAPTAPLSPYGVEKLYGEHMCRLFAHLYGMQTASLRYFNVYGPRQNPRSEYAAVVPKFITQLLAGEQPTIFGDGEQTRDLVFVEDVARANLLAASAEGMAGQVMNVAGGRSVSVNELYSALRAVTRVKIEARHEAERPGDIRHSAADITAARQRLGFEPSVTLEEGLARTVAYYREAAKAAGGHAPGGHAAGD